jgi:hypothetical protein
MLLRWAVRGNSFVSWFATGGMEYDLLWGEFHKHVTGHRADLGELDDVLGYAREHLDVVAVLAYPFEYHRRGEGDGVSDESIGNRPQFERWWGRVTDASARHNDPGAFVTFPAYEWHGDRSRWGDHNVVYREEGPPLDDARDLADLYANLSEGDVPALALPHHTGYAVGRRGKDWDCFDAALSPVMEVYSGHGSSEAVGEGLRMENRSMGPRTSGGTLRDGLDRGHRVGVIAGNDGWGVPGTPWHDGVTGVWTTDCTREAVWEALEARRTFGASDRIELWWELDGEPMGAAATVAERPSATARLDCPRPLDVVEVVGDGRVLDAHSHRPDAPEVDPEDRYRLLVEMGWGPTTDNGDFEDTTVEWDGTLSVAGGDLTRVWPRFDGMGQRYEHHGDCSFSLTTRRDAERPQYDPGAVQGLVVEVAGADATLVVDLDRETLRIPLADAREGSHLVAFEDEAAERIERAVGAVEDVRNVDTFYQHAPKVRVGRAEPRAACSVTVTFTDLPNCEYHYVRGRQVDGHRVWGSPVWSV